MKNLKILIIFFFSILSFLSVKNAECDKFEFNESHTKITIPETQCFIIQLQSNKTTGYEWQLAEPLDEKIVKFIKSDYKTKTTKLIGAGGIEYWSFVSTGPGKTKIKFKYVRPWEKTVLPAQEKEFDIIVK